MKEEEKFDELLRTKLSEREFAFDESAWDKVERRLVRQEQRRKILPFSLFFFTGLLTGVIIMILLPFAHKASPGQETSLTTIPQNAVSSGYKSIPGALSKESTTKTIQKGKESFFSPQSPYLKNNNGQGISGLYSNPSPVDIRKKRSISSSANETVSAAQNQTLSTGTVASAGQSTEHTKSNQSNSTDNSFRANSITTGIVTNTNDTGKNNLTRITPPADTAIPSKMKNDSVYSDTSAGHQVSTSGDENTAHFKNILSVFAGAGYSLGWNTNGERQANVITPWGGLDYIRYFTSNIAASIGIGYSCLYGLNMSYTSTFIQYSFGENEHIISVTPQTIYYLAFPLNFQYNLNHNNIVSAGFNYMVVLTTSSLVKSYQQNALQGETAISSEKENGYTRGFSNHDIQVAFSYAIMLTNRSELAIEGYLGLVYVENSSFPGISGDAKNNGFRVVYSYQLIK